MATDYSILAAPRISAAGFAAVLAGARSPAASIASSAYSYAVGAGVDPAVLLAIFRKESSYGTAGVARYSHGWANQRSGPPYVSGTTFTAYSDWLVGAQAAVRLLVVYGRNQIRPGQQTSTVRTLPYVWAPASDGNAPTSYGAQLADWIGGWSSQYPPSGGAAGGSSYAGVGDVALAVAQQPATVSMSIDFGSWFRRIIAAEHPGSGDMLEGRTTSSTLTAQDANNWAAFFFEYYSAPANAGNDNWFGLAPAMPNNGRPIWMDAATKAAAPYVGKTFASLPDSLTVDGLPKPDSSGSIPNQAATATAAAITAAVGALGDVFRSTVMLGAILVLVILGLYLATRS